MTKRRLSQLLNILLLPYIEADFLKAGNDFIENLRYYFARMEYGTERKESKKVYYKSEKQLIRFFQEHTELSPRTLDDFRLLIGHYFPEREIVRHYKEQFDDTGKQMCKDDPNRHAIEDFYLKNICRIAKSLLTFRDGRIAIRTWINEREDGQRDIFDHQNAFDKVEIWNILNRLIVPDVFIAAFFLVCKLEEPSDLEGQTGIIMMADKEMQRIMEKGIAETHVHMGVCIEYETYWGIRTNIKRWTYVLSVKDKKPKDRIPLMFSLAFFRVTAAEYFEKRESGKIKNQETPMTFGEFFTKKTFTDRYWKYKEYAWKIIDSLNKGEELPYDSIYWKLGELLSDEWSQGESTGDIDFLMHTVYRDYQIHTYSEMIFLQRYLRYLCENGKDDLYMRHMFFQYLRVKNNFFKEIVQRNDIEGLTNFKEFYSANSEAAKREEENKYDLIFGSMSNNYCLKKLELRTAPLVTKFSQGMGMNDYSADVYKDQFERVGEFLEEYKKFIIAELNISREEQDVIENKTSKNREEVCRKIDERQKRHSRSIPTIGLILHLIKKNDAELRMADRCWLVEGKSWTPESHRLILWRKQMEVCAKEIEKLRSSIPYLAEYLVGMDAASEENVAEPWIFAPAFRGARDKEVAKPFINLAGTGEKIAVCNMGLTFHVGEEFRHILSGLRHVDEVITHFKYKTGDRLGHAIVLATDIDEWVEENEMVVMPLQEYMDNLLWLWGKAIHEELDMGVSLDIIQGKILELAKEIYGEIVGMTPDMLYEAYLEKFRLTDEWRIFEELRQVTDKNPPDKDNLHFCRFYDSESKYGIMWTKDKIFCTLYCPVYYKKLYQPILVPVRKHMIPLYKKVQEQLVRRVEQIGIYVETNPTSNFIISGIKNLKESTAIKLNDKDFNEDGHEVMVTVNSDDPGVFNTTSENELAYVYHSLSNMGYGKESVIAWVDKIRQAGIDSSFIKKEKTASQILFEIAEILKYVRS